MDLNNVKQVISPALKEAGEILANEYQRFNRTDVTFKTDHQIVTRFDLLSEKIIIKKIKENFPEHGILSEEMGRETGQSEWLWVIDPLDGTTNFTMHNPMWAISVALFHKEEPVIGMIYNPLAEELFTAAKDQGSYMNSDPIKVSNIQKDQIINSFCHGSDLGSVERAVKYYGEQKLNNLDCRQFGSASLELAYVAAGRIETIVIPGAHSWDVAAGVLLVREAGGKVTDFTGKDWNLNSIDMAASNGILHTDLIKTVSHI